MEHAPARRWPIKFVWLILAGLLIFFPIRAYYRWTDDFRIANITHDIPYHPEWDTSLSHEELAQLKSILDQPFTYIGKGAQAYAFASEDGKYVLKFFKFKHLRPNTFLALF